MYSRHWASSHGEKIIRRLELNIFPWLGNWHIKEIKPPELFAVLRGAGCKVWTEYLDSLEATAKKIHATQGWRHEF